MLKRIRSKYLKVILPTAIVFLLMAALLLIITQFGIVYAFKKPVSLSSLDENELKGSYASVKVDELGDTFSYYGYTDKNEERVVLERYNVYLVGNKFLTVRTTGKAVKVLEDYDNIASLIESGQIGSILEANIGTLTGTINDSLDSDVYNLLGKYIEDYYLKDPSSDNPVSSAIISALNIPTDTDEDIDYSVYYKDLIIPLQLEAGYYGVLPSGEVILLSVIALICFLVFLGLIITVLTGLWEKPTRAFIKIYGKAELEEDYKTAASFNNILSIGKRFIWHFKFPKSELINMQNVIWIYPRSRRLEGGKHTWYLIIKTDDNREYSIHLDEASTVQAAVDSIKASSQPMTVGYDKEKQKLYERDIATFKARVKNNTI